MLISYSPDGRVSNNYKKPAGYLNYNAADFVLTSFIRLILIEYLFNDYRRNKYSESSDQSPHINTLSLV